MDTNAQRKPDWIDTVDPLTLREAMVRAVADMKKAQAVVERHSPGSLLLFEMECGYFLATLEHVGRCSGLFHLEQNKHRPEYALVKAMYEKALGRAEHLGVGFDYFSVPMATLGKFLKMCHVNAVRVFTCRLNAGKDVNVILELKLIDGRIVVRTVQGRRTN